jgi:hypothetical protein
MTRTWGHRARIRRVASMPSRTAMLTVNHIWLELAGELDGGSAA